MSFSSPGSCAYLRVEFMSTNKGHRGGDVINIASMGGLVPMSFSPVYCASKHGVVGFTRSMKVVCVCVCACVCASVLACLCVFLQVCGLRTMCMCIHVYMAAGCVHVYMAAGCVTSILIVPSPHSLIISQLRLALATVHNFYAG